MRAVRGNCGSYTSFPTKRWSPHPQSSVMTPINRVVFLGSKDLGLRVLQEIRALSPDTLVGAITIDDRADTRGRFDAFSSFAETAQLPLHVATSRAHAEQLINELRPDFCLVVGWYWLVSAAAIAAVPHGFVGIHNSLLPRYRGGSPLVWQILQGEPEAGFSVFSFTPGMDDGAIWAQGRVTVERDDQIATVLDKMERATVDVVRDWYPRLLDGSATPTEQDHSGATYCAQRSPADGRIDWRASARRVHDFIRAQSEPYPGAFTVLGDREIRVWKAREFPHIYIGTPGQVARVSADGVTVICGDDRAVILEDIEIGGVRGPAQTLIKSITARLT
jgi:methionyl-tRNA formyltransferase